MRTLDALAGALIALACIIWATGGIRTTVGGLFISITSPIRPLIFGLVIAVVRHALSWQHPTLLDRLNALGGRLFGAAGTDPMARDDFGAPARPVTVREALAVAGLMLALTVILNLSQVLNPRSVSDLGDPLFSIWRLAWIAHQLPREPLRLFDANIFYPAPLTLAYSDSLLLPGLAAAPFIWLGAPPIIVHTLWILASFVLAGMSMYLFMRTITGQAPAGLVAGVAFAFYPYRFDQYPHFEQLFSFWMPLALWALHRTITHGRIRDGMLTGAAIAAQYLSGMYLGVFFVAWLVPVWAVLALRRGTLRATAKPLVAGAALAVLLIAPSALPHLAARAEIGERTPTEVQSFSARPDRYLVSQPERFAYGQLFGAGRHEGEKDLFPGILIALLAFSALRPPLSRTRFAYLLALVVAYDASLGVNGHIFPVLYGNFLPFRAFRVPTRFSMLVGLSLALLAGYGAARLTCRRSARARYAITAVLVAALAVEMWVPRPMRPVPPQAPSIYQWFEEQQASVVAELPAGDALRQWDPECSYLYFSTFHWQRLLNGYSGAAPPTYESFRRAMQTFPDDASVALLRQRGAQYVVLHEQQYGPARYRDVIDALDRRAEMRQVLRTSEGGYEARIYAVLK